MMAANIWKNSLKNVESDNNNFFYETVFDFLERNGTYCLNKPRTSINRLLLSSSNHVELRLFNTTLKY